MYWPLHIGGWVAFGLAWAVGRTGEMSLAETVVREAPFTALAALVTATMHIVYVRVRLHTASPVVAAAVGVGVSFVGALAWTVAYNGYLRSLGPALLSTIRDAFVPALQSGMLLDGTVFHWTILLGWTGLHVSLRYYSALRDERERTLRAEARAHRARLQALRYQLNPHFLFNALNGISTLVTEVRTREATDMLAQLSDFLRLTLETDDAADVTLANEAEFVRRYLDIEQVRFGDRLKARVDIAPDVRAATVPALILQPLVENAVRYAVAPREEGGCIAVEGWSEDGDLVLTVSDDGPGSHSGDGGLGVGLANVRGRLHELYGDAGRVDVQTAASGGLRVSLRFPLHPLPAAS